MEFKIATVSSSSYLCVAIGNIELNALDMYCDKTDTEQHLKIYQFQLKLNCVVGAET